jgi:nucleotide-binding universal stress UspA family protein
VGNPIVAGIAFRDDHDAAAVALARNLARLTGAPLALVHVYPRELTKGGPLSTWDAHMRARATEQLEAIAAPLRHEHEVSVFATAGASAPAALHDAAVELDASALVAGSTHRGHVGRVMPGSVSARLLHGTPCAVAVAPRGYAGDKPIARIGVAFSDTEESREALGAAAGLAAFGGARISVFTVREPVDWGGTEIPGWIGPEVIDQAHEEQAEAAIERARGIVPAELLDRAEVLAGEPAVRLAAVSRELDLLVCGSRGYGPIRSVLLGGVSRRLVEEAACPILVLPRAPADAHGWMHRHRAAAAEA